MSAQNRQLSFRFLLKIQAYINVRPWANGERAPTSSPGPLPWLLGQKQEGEILGREENVSQFEYPILTLYT